MRSTVYLAKHRDKRIRGGHPWVFSNEITQISGSPETGDLVDIRRVDGMFLGVGFYHPHSLIAVRLLSRESIEADRNFFRNRLLAAIRSRNMSLKDFNGRRLVHSESDGLPGLIIDQYNKAVSIQCNSAGMEKYIPLIAEIITELTEPEVIVLRNDTPLRELEGLPQEKRVYAGNPDAVVQTIQEDDILYTVNALDGQKTGFYLDQRDNRLAFRRFISPGDHVFDGFCNEGGFAMHAAKAGAGNVVAADAMSEVLERASKNAKTNQLPDIHFLQADLMRDLDGILSRHTFDVINLDPPNFTRSRKHVSTARQAYRKIHQQAISHLKPGGILCTASCSHHITEEAFLETIHLAGSRNNRSLRILFRGSQPSDHPVLLGMPETEYLKFFAFQLL